MPAYNSELFLQEAVESVLNQTYQNLQVLILDDGSTDNTVAIAKQFTDPRIEVLASPVNRGQAHQLNLGILKAEGDFICIMHSDDIMHEQRIQQQYDFLCANPSIGLCGANIQLIGEANEICVYPFSNQQCRNMLLSANPFAHSAVFFRKIILADIEQPYSQDMVPAEDYDLWVRLAVTTRFGNLQEVLLDYRIHPNQIGQTKKDREADLLLQIRRKIITDLFAVKGQVQSQTCLEVLYVNTAKFSLNETVQAIDILWTNNMRTGFFEQKVLRGRLKHICLQRLSLFTRMQRLKAMISNRSLRQICFTKTFIRILIR